jgi:membrane protease YdiL (CAAX protease family)
MPDFLLMAITPFALVAGALVGRWRAKLDPREGLGLRLPDPRVALRLAAAFAALLVATEIVYQAMDLDDNASDWRGKYDAGALALRMLFVILIYPVAEELFFRGFLFGLIRRRFGTVAAIVAPALMFALLHGQYELTGMLLILVDGIFFGYARWRSGSLFLPMAFHIVGNGIAVAQRLM